MIKINLTENYCAPILQPILRDTSPNALRAEQLKKDFNKNVLKNTFCVEVIK